MDSSSTVLELGCGVTGLLGIVLAKKVSNYILTDQNWVMKVLQENLDQNASFQAQQNGKGKKVRGEADSNLYRMALDWEADSPDLLLNNIPSTDHINVVIICDCVYNEYLIEPLIQTLVDICRLGPAGKPVSVFMAQQLRSSTVFETFLDAMLQRFVVWRIPDSLLSNDLKSGSGYALHIAQLKRIVPDCTKGRV